MKMLFIGGTGVISSACAQLAVDRGIDLYLLNRGQTQRPVPEGATVLHGDIDAPGTAALLADHVWDVVVDLRPDSPTYRKWQAFELSEECPQSLYIPEGFAHGFLTLSDTATLVYAVNRPRCIESERVVRWNDPQLAIHEEELCGALLDSDKSQQE